MNKLNTAANVQTGKGCDEEPENASGPLGGAAETAGDLESETSGKKVAEHTASEDLHTKNKTTVESGQRAPTLDPICGMSVDERTARHIQRDGKTFYFCSDRCLQTFTATIAGVKSDSKAGSCCG